MKTELNAKEEEDLTREEGGERNALEEGRKRKVLWYKGVLEKLNFMEIRDC